MPQYRPGLARSRVVLKQILRPNVSAMARSKNWAVPTADGYLDHHNCFQRRLPIPGVVGK